MATAAQSTAIAKLSASEKSAKIHTLQTKNAALSQRLTEITGDYSRRVSTFVKKELPAIAMGAGAGAAIGGLAAYFLHDRMREWFGAGSYVGLLGTAALGVVVIVATPSLVKVTKANLVEQGPMQAGLYGFGVGMLGAGGYLAYRDWPQA